MKFTYVAILSGMVMHFPQTGTSMFLTDTMSISAQMFHYLLTSLSVIM